MKAEMALELANGIALCVGLMADGKLECTEKEGFRLVAREVQQVLLSGQFRLVLWADEIWKSAVQGCESFNGIPLLPDTLPTTPSLWLYHGDGKGLYMGDPNPPDASSYGFSGMYIYPSNRNIGGMVLKSHGTIRFYFSNDPDFDSPFVTRWEPGVPYNTPTDEAMACVVAASEFLKLPFVYEGIELPNHAARKTYKKQDRTIPAIRTVLLRAPSKKQSENTEHSSREYACQFLVSSHWRRPNHRMKEQRPVYVRPYIKGEAGKPFKARRTVFIATR